MTLTTTLSSAAVADVGSYDFYCGCETFVLANGEADVTYLEGTDYVIPASLNVPSDGVLFFISSTRSSGMGATSGGGNQDCAEWSCWLANSTDVLNQIRIRRGSSVGDCRVTIQYVLVTNESSTARFSVRSQHVLNFASGDTTVAAPSTTTAPNDDSKVVVFLTGQHTTEATRGRAHRGKFTTEWTGTVAQATRGYSGEIARASVLVVEFSSEWNVQRLAFDSPDDAVNIWRAAPNEDPSIPLSITGDLSGAELSDISNAFLHCQFRNSVALVQGNDDQGEVVELTGTNELTVRKSSNDNPTSKHHVVWAVEWAGPGSGTPPTAEHVSAYVGASEEPAEEGVTSRTITAVGSATNTSIMGGSSSSQGTTNGTPRGNVDLCLSSTTTVDERRSDTAQPERRAYTVFQWPIGSPLGTSNFRYDRQLPGPVASRMGSPGSVVESQQQPGPLASQTGQPGPVASQRRLPGSLASRSK